MSQMRAILVTTLLAATVVAEISSGGGTTTSSSSKNTASIGSPFTPSRISSTATTNRNGFTQFVYAAKLNPDQDRNSLPDEWEVLNFGNVGQSAFADPENKDRRSYPFAAKAFATASVKV